LYMLLCECVRVYCFFTVLPVYVLLCAAYGVIKNDDDDDDDDDNFLLLNKKLTLSVKLSTYGTRTFSCSSPAVWNSLPEYLKRLIC